MAACSWAKAGRSLLPLLLPLEYAVQLFLGRDHSTVGDLEFRHAVLVDRACYDRPLADCNVIADLATEDHPALSDSQVVTHLQGSVQHGAVPSREPVADLEIGALERVEGHPRTAQSRGRDVLGRASRRLASRPAGLSPPRRAGR